MLPLVVLLVKTLTTLHCKLQVGALVEMPDSVVNMLLLKNPDVVLTDWEVSGATLYTKTEAAPHNALEVLVRYSRPLWLVSACPLHARVKTMVFQNVKPPYQVDLVLPSAFHWVVAIVLYLVQFGEPRSVNATTIPTSGKPFVNATEVSTWPQWLNNFSIFVHNREKKSSIEVAVCAKHKHM